MAYYVKGKGWFESSGVYIGSARKMALVQALRFGRQGDRASFTRLVIESRVAMPILLAEYRKGAANPVKPGDLVD